MVRCVRVLKVEPGHSCKITLQSGHFQLVTTHWFGRQFVCPGHGCPACEGYQARISCFFLATCWTGKVWIPGMFEICPSELARLQFMMSWDADVVRAGACVMLSRKGPRTSVRCEPLEQDGGEILAALDSRPLLVNSVCRLLRLPHLRSDETADQWQSRVRPFLIANLDGAIRKVG